MTTGWRLEVPPPVEPGRIIVQGREQFITRIKGSDKAGVEMRYGNIDVNLEAENRLEDVDNTAIQLSKQALTKKDVLNEINLYRRKTLETRKKYQVPK